MNKLTVILLIFGSLFLFGFFYFPNSVSPIIQNTTTYIQKDIAIINNNSYNSTINQTIVLAPHNTTSELISNQSKNETVISVQTSTKNIKIANWNLQIFGDTKASKPEVMNFYANTIKNYDIVFIQEIRDADGSSFISLCSMLTEYNCEVSSRAGRSSSKEQYGIVYKRGISLINVKDFNPDTQDRWERPPIEATFNITGYTFTAYNIHTKPEAVSNELTALQNVVQNSGNVLILGDLNADCSYYDNSAETQFDSWNWIIKDSEDTTVSQTICAYDRIILNDDMEQEFYTYGIYTEGITTNISDHYLVWIELKI